MKPTTTFVLCVLLVIGMPAAIVLTGGSEPQATAQDIHQLIQGLGAQPCAPYPINNQDKQDCITAPDYPECLDMARGLGHVCDHKPQDLARLTEHLDRVQFGVYTRAKAVQDDIVTTADFNSPRTVAACRYLGEYHQTYGPNPKPKTLALIRDVLHQWQPVPKTDTRGDVYRTRAHCFNNHSSRCIHDLLPWMYGNIHDIKYTNSWNLLKVDQAESPALAYQLGHNQPAHPSDPTWWRGLSRQDRGVLALIAAAQRLESQ